MLYASVRREHQTLIADTHTAVSTNNSMAVWLHFYSTMSRPVCCVYIHGSSAYETCHVAAVKNRHFRHIIPTAEYRKKYAVRFDFAMPILLPL